MRKPLIAGNWKLNGNWQLCQHFISKAAPEIIGGESGQAEVVICPPAVYLAKFSSAIAAASSVLKLGAQDVSAETSGAYTGEYSADMLEDSGVQYGIVGHSERREIYAETDGLVAQKVQRLLQTSVRPIVCVGENLAQREAGQEFTVIEAQLASLSGVLEGDNPNIKSVVIAYEPIWAIGTGKTASSEQAQEVHAHIRAIMARYIDVGELRIIYGGSVKPDNAAALLAMPDVDGALVGGASLNVEQLLSIAHEA